MTELRVTVPDDVAERLTERARQRRTTPEQLAGEAVRSFVGPFEPAGGHRLSFIGIGRSGAREPIAERHEEIIRDHFTNKSAADV
jgi:hypothetical protein